MRPIEEHGGYFKCGDPAIMPERRSISLAFLRPCRWNFVYGLSVRISLVNVLSQGHLDAFFFKICLKYSFGLKDDLNR